MKARVYLIIITGWNPNKAGGAGLETRYFGTHGFCSSPTDTPPNTFFEPRVSNPGLYSQSMYSDGSTGGSSTGGAGTIELVNTDFALDELVDWGFDSNPCTILEGLNHGSLADFSTVVVGTIEQVEHSWSSISFRFKDRTVEFDKPVALSYYTGGNVAPYDTPAIGLEGVADIKGKEKPRLLGARFNISPVMVNEGKRIYQYNDGPTLSVGAVRDSGNTTIVFGADHANSTLLLAAATAAGTFDTCLSKGLIKLGSNPFGQVTMGAVASAASIGQTIRTLAIEKVGANSITEQSIIDLDKAIPASVVWGFYTGQKELTTKAVFDELAKAGIWWGFENLGRFWAKSFSEPALANSILTISGDDLLSVERVATEDANRGVPVWKVRCRYKRNNTVQTFLAGSVAPGVYDKEWLEASFQDPNDGTNLGIRKIHPLATELVIDSPFETYADALSEATRQFYLRSVRRDRLKVDLPIMEVGPISYPIGGYWDDEAISEMPIARYNFSALIYNNWLYVVGGLTTGGVVTASVIRLNLANPTGAWDDIGVTDLPATRWNHSCAIYNGYLYVLGGQISGESASVIRLNLANPTGAWDDIGVTDLPTTRSGGSAVTYNGYLYVIGGFVYNAVSSSVIRLNLANPTGAWDDIGVTDLPSISNTPKSALYNNWLYILSPLSNSSVLRLDLNNPAGVWDDTGVTDLPVERYNFSCDICGNFLVVVGGTISGLGNYEPSVIRLDLNNPTGAWDDIGVTDLPAGRQRGASIAYNNALYTVGGSTVTAQPNTWRLRTNDNPDDAAQLTSLGRTYTVKMKRYGYAAGRPMRIIGMTSDHTNRKVTMELWG